MINKIGQESVKKGTDKLTDEEIQTACVGIIDAPFSPREDAP